MSELKPRLLGYAECRCILTQYCDGECRPIFEGLSDLRCCANGDCNWRGMASETLQMKRGSPKLLCPVCNEVTELDSEGDGHAD